MSSTKRVANLLGTDSKTAVKFCCLVQSLVFGMPPPSFKVIAVALEKYPALKRDPQALAEKISVDPVLSAPADPREQFAPWVLEQVRREQQKEKQKEEDTRTGSVYTVRGGLPGSGRRS